MPPIVDDSDDDIMPTTSRYQTVKGNEYQITTWRNRDRSWAISVVGLTNTEIGRGILVRLHNRTDALRWGERYINEHCG